MTLPWLGLPLIPALAVVSVLGLGTGLLMEWWAERLMLNDTPTLTGRLRRTTRIVSSLGTAILFVFFVWAFVDRQVQQIPEVQPSEFGRFCQIVFQLTLISLLVGMTITDVWDYVIPDQMILVGVAIGLGGHLLAGELQIQHIWVDWNAAEEGIRGQYFPPWIDNYRHLHGLLVGLTGLFVGAGITWLVRFVSSSILGQETMGLGDVTLMAMIGSFLGWQPVLFVFALAPLTGVVVSIIQKLLGGKTYLAYGPFLAVACLLVLLTWRYLWTPLRDIFGHPPSLAVVIGFAAVAFVVLLMLLRMYRAIPISESNRYSPLNSSHAEEGDPPADAGSA